MSWVLCVTNASIWVPETHIVINGGYFSKDEKDRRRFCKDCPPEALTRPNPLRAIITCSFVRNYVSLAFEDELLHVTDSRSCHDVRTKDPNAWQLTDEWRTLKILRSLNCRDFFDFLSHGEAAQIIPFANLLLQFPLLWEIIIIPVFYGRCRGFDVVRIMLFRRVFRGKTRKQFRVRNRPRNNKKIRSNLCKKNKWIDRHRPRGGPEWPTGVVFGEES